MKTYIDCIPCFMDQALRAGRIATNDEAKIKELLDYVGSMIKDIPMENTPPETGDIIYRAVRKITGVDDPYKEIKKINIKEALALYPELKKIVSLSENRLLTGRYAPQELIEAADLVTEMKEVKHYYQQGIEARRGIEY